MNIFKIQKFKFVDKEYQIKYIDIVLKILNSLYVITAELTVLKQCEPRGKNR